MLAAEPGGRNGPLRLHTLSFRAQANDNLSEALERADARIVVEDHYQDAGSPWHGRIVAVWRGGKNKNVEVKAKRVRDFKTGERYNVWSFLTEIVGLNAAEAAKYLLWRFGHGRVRPGTFRATRGKRYHDAETPQPTPSDKLFRLEAAHQLQRSGATAGASGYLERKGLTAVFETHEVASARLPNGEAVPGMVFIRNRADPFVQLALRDSQGNITGYQRIYDNGDKRFVTGSKPNGAYVLLEPRGQLASTDAIVCEGFATGASSASAHPGTRVFCALTANNLGPVPAVLRAQRVPRSTITIAADNDRYKPESGNAGLERAHLAGLMYGCKVASPSFQKLDGQPTDFNDLHLREGPEAVQAQLASPAQPLPIHAFAAERRRLHRKLASSAATTGQRAMPVLSTLPEGVTLVRAPQGTGKTEALAPLIADAIQQEKRVLYITHRKTLASDAARRLGLEVYSDEVFKYHLHMVPALACCVNSLHRLADKNGNLSAFDMIIVDESEQFVRALSGKHIAHKCANLQVFETLLQRAGQIVMLDADLGKLTYRLLEEVRPNENYYRVTHYYPVGEGRTIRLHDRRDGAYAAMARVTGPMIVFTNSKQESEAAGAFLESQGKRGLVLNADTVTDAAAFIENLDESTRDLDYLVCSPTVGTGVSLTSGHFKHVFGLFYATVGIPEDALQSLWRVRTPATYDVWTDERARNRQFDVDARYGETREHEAGLLGRNLGHASELYRSLVTEIDRVEQRGQAHYRLGFIKLAVLQGFDVELVDHDPAHRGLARTAREAAKRAHYGRVASARRLERTEAAELRSQRALTFDDRLALERYRVEEFCRRAQDENLMPWLELDDRGRYQRRIARLELTLADDASTQKAAAELLVQLEMREDVPLLASRRQFYQRVLEATGFDEAARLVLTGKVDQLSLPRYSPKSLEQLREWIEANRSWLAGLLALPAADKLKANVIPYVGSWLRALGLKQKRTGKNARRSYSIEIEALTTACSLMSRRGTLFPKDSLLQKTVPAPPTDPKEATAWIAYLLNSGWLNALDPQKLCKIRQMLQTNTTAWLQKLAYSRDLGRLLETVT